MWNHEIIKHFRFSSAFAATYFTEAMRSNSGSRVFMLLNKQTGSYWPKLETQNHSTRSDVVKLNVCQHMQWRKRGDDVEECLCTWIKMGAMGGSIRHEAGVIGKFVRYNCHNKVMKLCDYRWGKTASVIWGALNCSFVHSIWFKCPIKA